MAAPIARGLRSSSRLVSVPRSRARASDLTLLKPTSPLSHYSRRTIVSGYPLIPQSLGSPSRPTHVFPNREEIGITSRSFSSTPRWRERPRYERFDSPYSSGPSSGGGSGGQNWSGSSGGSSGGGGSGGKAWSRHPIFLALRRRLGDRGLLIWSVGLVGGGVYYIFHLERVPETGRWRFIDVSESQETQLGLQTQKETIAQYQNAILPSNHPTTRRVREVARRIVESNGLGHMKNSSDVQAARGLMGAFDKAFGTGEYDGNFNGDALFGGESSGSTGKIPGTDRQDTEWEVFVIRDNTKNAFVIPGGKIFVFEGILPVCKNDDGLAGVLGHEIAHQGYLLEALGLDVGITRLLLTFLLHKACFDPRETTELWRRMSHADTAGSRIPGFLSTHPANKQRISQLEKWMPEALDVRAATHCGDTASQFESFKEHLPRTGPAEVVWS